MSEEERKRIEQILEDLKDPNSEASQRFREAGERWDRELKPLQDAIKESERITEEDLRIIVR